MLRSAGVRVLRSGRLLSSTARSRVKILGSDDAYKQIATVSSGFFSVKSEEGGKILLLLLFNSAR